MSQWVTKAKYAEMTGLSDGQVRARIETKWVRGLHFVVDGKVTMINLREVNRWWATREELDRTKLVKRSKSAIDATDAIFPKPSSSSLRKLA